ncbi:MAG: right-handed parallel beta-helix repeat-containing protein [Clostridia bacterium]|nr:right-handed parallel beta-helix repeat-containing protein [Clostridia bacterium]
MRFIGIVSLLFLVLCLPFGARADEGDLYVSPHGSDANPGTLSAPLATLSEAVARLRGNRSDERLTVWLREGTYPLDEVLILNQYDRGNCTFASYPGETAVITGAVPVTGWAESTLHGAPVYTVQYPTMSIPRTLYAENGARRLARWPKEGYLRALKPLKASDTKFDKQPGFFVDPNDVPLSLEGALLRLLHWWKDELSAVNAYDPLRGELTVNRPMSMTVTGGDRYYLENVLSARLAPGEWAFDAAERVLYYAPLEDETADGLIFYTGVLEQLIYINGVSGVTFQNLTFARTAWNIPRGDLESDFAQAAYDANAVIRVLNALDTRFIGCSFTDIGAGCIQLGAVKGAVVQDCTFQNIGAHAVYVHGANTRNDAAVTEGILIERNRIEGYGRNFLNAAAVLVIHVRNAEISRNEIHDGAYTAISAGWVWGDAFSATRNIQIQNNLIYDIGRGALSDMGGVYLLGSQQGTVVEGNVIHGVTAAEYGGWGIYLDEGSSKILVANNLVYRCSAQGFHQHAGADNTVKNNVFALNYDGQLALTGKGSFTLESNVIVGTSPHIRNDGGTIRQGQNLFSGDHGVFVDALRDNYAIADLGAVSAIGFIPWVYLAGRVR